MKCIQHVSNLLDNRNINVKTGFSKYPYKEDINKGCIINGILGMMINIIAYLKSTHLFKGISIYNMLDLALGFESD